MKRENVKRWNNAIAAIFEPLEKYQDRRRRKKSFEQPVICGYGRDRFKFYENGRSVVIAADLNFGGKIVRSICRNQLLKWDNSDRQLSDVEAEHVFEILCTYLDCRNISWGFSDVPRS